MYGFSGVVINMALCMVSIALLSISSYVWFQWRRNQNHTGEMQEKKNVGRIDKDR